MTPHDLDVLAELLSVVAAKGPFEARQVSGGAPAEPCPYGVVGFGAGQEIARLWSAADTILLTSLLNNAPALISAARKGLGDGM
ncbi:MAG: hypothetical protein ACLGIM_10065 [Alphaproteobacteria bacterium]